MGVKQGLTLAVILGISASGALAQPAADPPLLKLPMGARVRLQTLAAPGDWMKGILVSADSTSVAIVPEDAPPLGNNQLVVPSASIARFELATGRKRHWLKGLISGVALGLVVGFTEEVDSSTCNDPYSYFGSSSDVYYCSRGEAVAVSTLAFGGLGAGIGALVRTDKWTPVALDALASPAPRVSAMAPRLRLLPSGGVEVGVAIGF